MRKMKKVISAMTAIAMLVLTFMVNEMGANASGNTPIGVIEGTVMSGSDTTILNLNTASGGITIILDADADFSQCTKYIKGAKVAATVYRAADNKLHASKIANITTIKTAYSDTATISGTVKKDSTSDVMYLTTMFGDMKVTMDTNTDFSECYMFCEGKNVIVTVAKKADGTYYAVKVSDGSAGTGSATGLSSTTTNTEGKTYTSTGTITTGSTRGLLCFNIDGSVMQVKVDANTTFANGVATTPGSNVTIEYYRGADCYMHAKTISCKRALTTTTIDFSTKKVYSGIVDERTSNDVLYLTTSEGTMIIFIDSTTNFTGNKQLYTGKSINVSCSKANDSLLHATTIEAK